MKLHINQEQFDQLSKKGKRQYREWVYKMSTEDLLKSFRVSNWEEIEKHETGYPPLLSIGQMLEFLGEFDSNRNGNIDIDWLKEQDECINPNKLCDALFEVVKEILEKK